MAMLNNQRVDPMATMRLRFEQNLQIGSSQSSETSESWIPNKSTPWDFYPIWDIKVLANMDNTIWIHQCDINKNDINMVFSRGKRFSQIEDIKVFFHLHKLVYQKLA